MSSHSVWSLLLAMCSYHALRPNGLWWLNKDATLPLSVFKHMKSQSTMFLCPFVMHDKTAWLQPHSKTYKKKTKIQDKTLTKKTVQKIASVDIFKEAATRTT